MSITAVICHTGLQNSFHVQVKLLSLSAPDVALGEREEEEIQVLARLQGAGGEAGVGWGVGAQLQSSPWVQDEKIYGGARSFH